MPTGSYQAFSDHLGFLTRKHHTWHNPNLTLMAFFSECVGPVLMGSFVPIRHRRGTKNGKGFGQQKSTQIEFHELGPWVRTGGTRCVLVLSERGLLSRYGTVGALYMEKYSVNKSQHITKYTSLDHMEEAFGTRRELTFVDRILFHI
jgi:hypothetical protein